MMQLLRTRMRRNLGSVSRASSSVSYTKANPVDWNEIGIVNKYNKIVIPCRHRKQS